MNDTVIINGREYQVEVVPDTKSFWDAGRPSYRLIGSCGARYRTFRNQPRPHLMFVTKESGPGFGALRNVWLTDKNGKLEQVK